ncbi:MAG: DsbA family protein [Myxococcota bacterium]
MTETIDTFWSFRSPYSYLATPDLLRLREAYDVQVRLRPVLPIAVRAKASLFDPADRRRVMYILLDSERRARQLGLPFKFPPSPDPVVQDYQTFEVAAEQPYIFRLSKLGVEAERRGRGLDFAGAVSRLIFGGTERWVEGDHLHRAAEAVGLDLDELDQTIEGGDHLETVEENQRDLEKAGHWGVPTMVLRGEPFFGQDRIETLRWRLDQLRGT